MAARPGGTGAVPLSGESVVGEHEHIDMPADGDAAVLLLHGLFGAPNEMHVLGGALWRAGYAVRIPLLPGRGASAAELERTTWEEWLAHARADLAELRSRHARVAVGGLSAGGTLALALAIEAKLDALLLYAPALTLRYRAAYLAPYLWRVVRRWPARGASGIGYERIPVRAVGETVRGMRYVRSRLALVRAPTLVVHAVDDPLVPFASAERVAAEVSGPVELVRWEGAEHAVTAGVERERVGELTLGFLARYMAV